MGWKRWEMKVRMTQGTRVDDESGEERWWWQCFVCGKDQQPNTESILACDGLDVPSACEVASHALRGAGLAF